MPCFRPLKAYRAPGGGVAFDSKRGYGDLPLDLPCGQCMGCRITKSREWALRCVHESQMHTSNAFITLTYSPQQLPRDGGIHVEHWQKFAKRLRKGGQRFRYLMCGEYGEKSLRPHYHAAIFGQDWRHDRQPWKVEKGHTLYESRSLTEAWGMGHVSIGELNYTTAHYVAKYILKKATGEDADKEYERINRKTGEVFTVRPPFVTMSRRPGLGASWLKKYRSDIYPADEVVHEGKKFKVPRFYDDQQTDEQQYEMKHRRKEKARKHRADLTPERLATREKILEKKQNELQRNL